MFNFKILFFIFCLYIYLYNPIFQVLGFGSNKILLVVSTFYIFANKSIWSFMRIFSKEFFLTIIIAFYALFTLLWGGDWGGTGAYVHIVWFLECFIIPFSILIFFDELFKKYEWETIVVFVGFLASLISVFLILNPDINQNVRDNILIDTLDEGTFAWSFRGFSIAESSSNGYGAIQGIILAICLFSIKQSKYFIIPVLFLFTSIIFNARIGIAPIAISLVFLFLYRQLSFKYIVGVLIIVFLGYWFLNFSEFAQENEDSLEWGLSIFEDTQNLAKGNDEDSNYSILFGNMFFLPENFINLIFGEGRDVFLALDKNSDMGYVLQIFRGGVFYLLLMLFFLWRLFNRAYWNSTNKILPVFFLITLLVLNIKGDAFFLSTSYFRLISFYYVYSILKEDKAID